MGSEDIKTCIGLMSGTSLDGIDVALLKTNGELFCEAGPWASYPYGEGERKTIGSAYGQLEADPAIERLVTAQHGAAVRRFIDEQQIDPEAIDLIGFHGQTVFHDPDNGVTVQLGDGDLLAEMTGIDVVFDFRSADVAAGGEGAPFASLYHAALASKLGKPIAVLNVGGVANVTWIGKEEGDVRAFDTGPGNALLDDWCRARTGQGFDDGGALASKGRVDALLLTDLLSHPYFRKPSPKSLDRDTFAEWTNSIVDGLADADGAALLTAFTASAVGRALEQLPEEPGRWLVCGGGRHNPAIMEALHQALNVSVEPVEAEGWQGDALEAQAFAYLAVRSLRGLPLSLPGTTGVKKPQPGGRLARVA